MIKLVIFDWNGVLIADTENAMKGGNEVIKAFGGNPVDVETYRAHNVIPSTDFYIQHGCRREDLVKDAKKAAEIFHNYYESHGQHIRSRGGVKKLLKWLKDNSISSVILSNHTVEGIHSQLHRLKIDEYFSQVYANDDRDCFMKGTTKKDKFLKIVSESKLKSSEIMIIGDSPEEVELAKSMKTYSAAITHGHYSTARLVKTGPDYLISTLEQLIGIIQKIK